MRRLLIPILSLLLLSCVASAAPGKWKFYGPTDENDHLWRVALSTRPSEWVTPQQTMIALLRLNPSAFARGNINGLRAHKWLKIPGPDMIKTISPLQAELMVASQNKQWRQLIKAHSTTTAKIQSHKHGQGIVIRSATMSQPQQSVKDNSPLVISNRINLPQAESGSLEVYDADAANSIVHPDAADAKSMDPAQILMASIAPRIATLKDNLQQFQTEMAHQLKQATLRIDVLEDENVALKKRLVAIDSTLHVFSRRLSRAELSAEQLVTELRERGKTLSEFIVTYGPYMAIASALLVLFFMVYGLFYRRQTVLRQDARRDVAAVSEHDDEDEDEYDFLNSEEGISAKLDLARAYIDMGDMDIARQVLNEVRQLGKPDEQQQAEKILSDMSVTTE